jgi:hypothetical protein
MADSSGQAAPQQTKDIMQYINEADKFFEDIYIKKAPFTIPEDWKEMIVKITPYLNILGIVMAIAAIPVLLGIGTLSVMFGAMSGATLNPLSNIGGILAAAFSLGGIVLSVMAAQGLFKRKASAWKLVFYGSLLSVVQSVLTLNIAGLAMTFIVGMYILYQIKSKYTN